jgi:Mrp family chromosome partitioning ATPase
VYLLPIVGSLFGLGLGTLGAGMIEMNNSHFCTGKELSLTYNIPTLGVIPEIPHLSKTNVHSRLLFYIRDIVDALDRLQTVSLKESPKRFFAIGSSIDSEGKSLIATELGRYYQRMHKKTLLFYSDPHGAVFVNKKLNKGNLLNVLHGEASIQDVIVEGESGDEPDSLFLGGSDPRLNELMKGSKMQDVLGYLRKKYDVVILDVPGIVETPYAVNLMGLADFNLMLIGALEASKETVNAALITLERAHARPLGLLLNRVPGVYVGDPRTLAEMGRQGYKNTA